jgi:hypothetical protein
MKNMPTSASHREPPIVPEPPQPAAAAPAQATVLPTAASPAPPVVPPTTPRVAPRPAAPSWRAKHLRTITLVGATFLIVAVVALPDHSSQPEPQELPADLAASAEPAALRAAPISTPIAVPVVGSATVARHAASAPSTNTLAPKPEKSRAAESAKSDAPVAEATPVAEAIAPPEPASVSAGTSGPAPVTITGCLEVSVDHDAYRLTETEGIDAPKSRSWRTGFLKKRSTPVALVEPRDGLALQTNVGRRVAATGLLVSRDLKVSALRVVSQSCN